jgi:hypothetical protein
LEDSKSVPFLCMPGGNSKGINAIILCRYLCPCYRIVDFWCPSHRCY